MSLIIDAPITPYSSIREMEDWLRKLIAMRARFQDDEHAIMAIEMEERITREWIERRKADDLAK